MRLIRGVLIAVGVVSILIGTLFLVPLLDIEVFGGAGQANTDNPLLTLLFMAAFIALGAILILFGIKLRNPFRSE